MEIFSLFNVLYRCIYNAIIKQGYGMKSYTSFEIIKTKCSDDGSIVETRFNEAGRITRRTVTSPCGSSETELYSNGGKLCGKISADNEGRKTNIRYKYGRNKGISDDECPIKAGITKDLAAPAAESWLLSGIHALNASAKGRKIIRESIVPHTDGSVTVHFKGSGRSCSISAEKIQNFASCRRYQDAYASGGADMLILELAAEKLRAEDLYSENSDKSAEKVSDDVLTGGNSLEIWEALVPDYKAEEIYGSGVQQHIPEILENVSDTEKDTAMCFSLYGSHSAQLTNGKTFKHTGPVQEYAVSYVSPDLAKFINPWNSSMHYSMSWSEFEKLRPFNISFLDFSCS